MGSRQGPHRQCDALDRESLGLSLASKFPRSQSNCASVGCIGQTSRIHGGSTLQLTGLKGSVAILLVPDATASLQGSSGVCASTAHVEC